MTAFDRHHAEFRILGRDYYGYGWRFIDERSAQCATSDRGLAGGMTLSRPSRSRS
ncbi:MULTISPECIES: hypothetical protein [Halomonas]|uniref:Uncharacterized protein n=1 Tax=Halomonas halophila TaxID=29573 RepID=A0ABQ0U2G5_9GAMM|nr:MULTISPECIES: hypothetical protein [Halomonas]MDR5890034.1 hypothetical protein [Halomonas salina]WJY06862.1 hypothetical protein QWG60_14360 [Halomonas halophila]GEK72714.1 hypothetical protein HHA04nite_12580 [Halomonas halophila]